MGRKKTKKQETKSPEEDALEILAEILEGVGIFKKKGGEESVWERCSRSIETLSLKLAQHRSSVHVSDVIGESTETIILDIEEAARFVRQDVGALSAEVESLDSGLRLCQDLELASPQLLTLAGSLKGALCTQKWIAQDTIHNVMRVLDHLYGAGADQFQSATIGTLSEAVTLFQKRCIEARHSPWREALSLLHDEYESSTSPPRSIEDVVAFGFEPTRNKLQLEDKHLSSFITHSTIFDAVQAFASGAGMPQPTFCSLSLIGPEGSGKTHCCDEIERLWSANINGKPLTSLTFLSIEYSQNVLLHRFSHSTKFAF